MKQRFKIFTSFVLAWTFLAIAISGFGLYLSPKGRIANWIQWHLWGFTKTEWEQLHTVFVTVFLIAVILHLFYFNWKPFLAYFKKKIKSGVHHRFELLTSIILFIILLGGTLWEIPPVFSINTLGENIKESYEVQKNEAPIPHAEELTISDFSDKVLSLPYNEVIERLENNGYTVSGPDQTIAEIAELHDVAPSLILTVTKGEQDLKVEIPSYSGYGRKTFNQVCSELELPVDLAIKRLNQAGILDINGDETIKIIADRYNQSPTEIVNIIAGE